MTLLERSSPVVQQLADLFALFVNIVRRFPRNRPLGLVVWSDFKGLARRVIGPNQLFKDIHDPFDWGEEVLLFKRVVKCRRGDVCADHVWIGRVERDLFFRQVFPVAANEPCDGARSLSEWHEIGLGGLTVSPRCRLEE